MRCVAQMGHIGNALRCTAAIIQEPHLPFNFLVKGIIVVKIELLRFLEHSMGLSFSPFNQDFPSPNQFLIERLREAKKAKKGT